MTEQQLKTFCDHATKGEYSAQSIFGAAKSYAADQVVEKDTEIARLKALNFEAYLKGMAYYGGQIDEDEIEYVAKPSYEEWLKSLG